MLNEWVDLTFIHWRYPALTVQRLLPAGLDVETFDGDAWVGLIPFSMRVAVPRTRPGAVPWLSRFPETNVRTYVRGPNGATGVWFFSLDAARLAAVLFAHASYGLPYQWSRMRVIKDAQIIQYVCRRRWPDQRGTRSTAVVEVGQPYAPAEVSDLDHFLTARFALFSALRRELWYARAFHDPWPLHRARLNHLRDELVTAAGLPQPPGMPLVHFSPGVAVRIGWPHAVS